MDKRYLLIIIALICIVLFWYGTTLNKDSPYLKSLPVIGGLAFGLNTLVQIAQ